MSRPRSAKSPRAAERQGDSRCGDAGHQVRQTLADAVKTATNGKSQALALDLLAKAEFPEGLREPVFAAAKDAIVGPIQTLLGWHVVQVSEIQAGHEIPFDQVKAKLAEQAKHDGAASLLADRIDKLGDKLFGGASMEDVAAGINATPVKFGAFDAKGNPLASPGAGTAPDAVKPIRRGWLKPSSYSQKTAAPSMTTRRAAISRSGSTASPLPLFGPWPRCGPDRRHLDQGTASGAVRQARRRLGGEDEGRSHHGSGRDRGWAEGRDRAAGRARSGAAKNRQSVAARGRRVVPALQSRRSNHRRGRRRTTCRALGGNPEADPKTAGNDLDKLQHELDSAMQSDTIAQYRNVLRDSAKMKINPRAAELVAGQ